MILTQDIKNYRLLGLSFSGTDPCTLSAWAYSTLTATQQRIITISLTRKQP